MNLPQLTAKLGAIDRKDRDVLHTLVKPLKIKRKSNESYYAVYLTFDVIRDCILLEDPFPYDEKILKRFYYFGNNSAAGYQTYLVRGTNSLHYLLTNVWNDLDLSLQKNDLSHSQLSQILQRFQSESFISLGSKKGQGHLNLEKVKFPSSFTYKSISYHPADKCIVVNDIKYKNEAFINLLLENENKNNRIVLVIPRIRDENGEIVLSQHRDYLQLVKQINQLDDSNLDASNQNHVERICYLCQKPKHDVSSSYSKKLSRSGINKIFTTTTINTARYSHDGYNYDDAYSICGACYKDLLAGEKVIEANFRGKIAGENAFILPEHLLEIFDYKSLGTFKEGLDIAFRSNEAEDWLNNVEADALWTDSRFYMVHFIVYRTDGNSVSILETIEDIPTLRVIRIMKLFRYYVQQVRPHLQGMSLGSIYRIIPVRETDKGQVDIGRVLSLYKAILSSERIRTEMIYSYACEALDKGLRQLSKSRLDNYKNMNLMHYIDGNEDFFIKSIVMNYLVLLHTLKQLQLLDRDFNIQEEIKMSDELVLRSREECSAEPVVETSSTIDQMEQYLDKHAFTSEARALFYLGVMVQKVAWEQFKKDHKTKPILKKIQFQGMKQREVVRLSNDVYEKFRQYRIYDSYTERLINRFNYNYGKIRDNWPLSEQATVFYLMSGYGYAAGNRTKRISKMPDNNNDIKETTTTCE
ncbi:TM1802 family CRISPR-associated protein [Paenibacillus larvae]|uniref:TM1802 family CRISPR-associated protein n=1 Tax=Paenibacillus larvae TaxID=1464 RepID=UPI00227FFC62|nr:TM1802 family CRISPR-associated protein [Paenibacillus larvae]MCY9512035.1 TM1802 family CRISPR-associated protein [Paenibacillus larvae]MCY9525784.1 TM1802 family CRISPR-associated protein [Paenibacillus larvae]